MNHNIDFVSGSPEPMLTDEEAAGFIADITQRTRRHHDIERGVSVRGSIAFRQVLEGYSLLENGIRLSGLEKAAMITLPPRIEMSRTTRKSAEAVIQEIIDEVLYGEDIHDFKSVPEKNGKGKKLSIDEFIAALQNSSLAKSLDKQAGDTDPEGSNFQIVPGGHEKNEGFSANALERDSRFKDRKDWFPALEEALKEMLGDLETKLIDGEISESDYRYQKQKLEEMLNTASYLDSGISEEELAGTVMEMMEAGDRQWQKDMDFQDMYVYYHIREAQSDSGLSMPKKNWYALKVIIDFLEFENLMESNEDGTRFTLTDKAIDILLDTLVTKSAKNQLSRSQEYRISKNGTERRQDTRIYSSGDVFRDISIRRTIKEIARQRRKLSEINRHDIRIFLNEYREPKSDIMLCIDTSGSMGFHGKFLMTRVTTAAIARAAFKNGDRVGIVTFDDLGRSMIEPTDEEDRIMTYISEMKPGGNTNIGDGIRCAGTLLKKERNGNRKVIMLVTDGEPTAISEKALSSMERSDEKDMTGEYAIFEVRKALSGGIETSVIHITDEKASGKHLVEDIAKVGHGEIKRIARPDDLRRIVL